MGWTGAITAQTKYVNPSGTGYDIEISQGNGVTAWRVKGATEWERDPDVFYNKLGANIKVAPKPPEDTSGGGTEGGYVPWNTPSSTPEPPSLAASVQAQMDKTVRYDTVKATVSSLTDSIPRPKTAQATPTPVSRYKMNKQRGKFTINI